MKQLVDQVKSDYKTRAELMRLEDETYYRVEAAVEAAVESNTEQRDSIAIKNMVHICMHLKGTKDDAINSIMECYNKKPSEAKELVEQYWV